MYRHTATSCKSLLPSRSHRRAFSIAAPLTILLAGCAAQPPAPVYDLFITSESVFFQTTERVALVPLAFGDDLEVPDSVITELESLLRQELELAGFEVIPSVVYGETWLRIVQDLGGIYDPYTGKRDDEQFEAASQRLRLELAEKFGPDVLLRPELWVVDAPYRNAFARWDGASQKITKSAFRFDSEGFVPALTLGIVVEDLAGAEVFVNGGGLEVLETLDTVVPAEALFGDPERIRDAVLVALEPLSRARERERRR